MKSCATITREIPSLDFFEVQLFCLDLSVIASVAFRVSEASSHAAPALLVMQDATAAVQQMGTVPVDTGFDK